MRTIPTVAEMQRFADEERKSGRTIAFVPTMGALHEGHLSLVREAQRRSDTVVVSIFVNPIQFNSRSDFEKYPRDDARDARLLEAAGVNALFLPSRGGDLSAALPDARGGDGAHSSALRRAPARPFCRRDDRGREALPRGQAAPRRVR